MLFVSRAVCFAPLHFFLKKKRARFFALAVVAICFSSPSRALSQDVLRLAGSSTVNLAISEAVQTLRAERGLQIQVSTTGGSTAGIDALGGGSADIAMVSHALTGEERAAFPDVIFTEFQIGAQVVALGVSRDVWESGVHLLDRDQARKIYEKKIRNWHELGGPDHKIAFFNFEENHGEWEMFAEWLYGDSSKAALGAFPTVANDEDARNTLEFTPGSITQISPVFIDGKNSFALEIRDDSGVRSSPKPADVTAKKYPMAHPLILVVNDKPTQNVKVLIDFMLSARGQAMLKKRGFFGAAEPGTAKTSK